MIDEDNDLRGLSWRSVNRINDRDDNISISLGVLVLVCMADTCDLSQYFLLTREWGILTVWLRDGKIEKPKGRNGESRSLHFERRVGDLIDESMVVNTLFVLICTGQRLSVTELFLICEEDSLYAVVRGRLNERREGDEERKKVQRGRKEYIVRIYGSAEASRGSTSKGEGRTWKVNKECAYNFCPLTTSATMYKECDWRCLKQRNVLAESQSLTRIGKGSFVGEKMSGLKNERFSLGKFSTIVKERGVFKRVRLGMRNARNPPGREVVETVGRWLWVEEGKRKLAFHMARLVPGADHGQGCFILVANALQFWIWEAVVRCQSAEWNKR